MQKIVVAITGASGSIYAKVLLDKLIQIPQQWQELSVVLTTNARDVWKTELDTDIESYLHKNLPIKFYTQQDFQHPLPQALANTIPC